MDNPNIELAISRQERFEFYFIALVFTILGLSIQTANLITHSYQYVFEIISWVLLLISGLTGLSRLEWIPVFYTLIATIQNEEEMKKKFENAYHGECPLYDENGDLWEEKDLLKELKEGRESIKEKKDKQKKLEKIALSKYKLHRLTFYVGLVSLVISRAIYGLTKLFI